MSIIWFSVLYFRIQIKDILPDEPLEKSPEEMTDTEVSFSIMDNIAGRGIKKLQEKKTG